MFDDVRPQAPPTSPLPSHAVRQALVRAGVIVPLGDADPAAPAAQNAARSQHSGMPLNPSGWTRLAITTAWVRL